MAFKLTKESDSASKNSKKRMVLAVLIVLILAALTILYFGFWRSSFFQPVKIPYLENFSPVEPEISIDEIIKEIDFDIDFLKSSRFQSLRSYREWPLEIKEEGRKNPFAP